MQHGVQQIQASILAIFRVKLRAKHVCAVYDAGNGLMTKIGNSCDIFALVTLKMKAMNMIEGGFSLIRSVDRQETALAC